MRTVEGISGPDGSLHPIQKSIVKNHGSQCGFCTPGFLVVISALLNNNPSPDDDEIKNAIEGNLCRCTGYQQIVDSVRSASKILTSGNENLNGTDPLSNPNPGFVK